MRAERNILLVLIWKNWHLMIRKPTMFALKIIVPVILPILIVVIKYHDTESHPEVIYPSYCAIQRPINGSFCSRESTSNKDSNYTPPEIIDTFNLTALELAYCPGDIPFVNKGMKGMKRYFTNVISLKTCKEFEGHVSKFNRSGDMLVGLEFEVDKSEKQGDGPPTHMDLKLRLDSRLRNPGKNYAHLWMTQKDATRFRNIYPGPRNEGLWVGEYSRRGFITLMGLVTHELIKAHDANFSFPEMRMRRFPFPSWTNRLQREATRMTVVMLTGFGHVFQFILILRKFVMEKRTHLKVAMKVMGVPHWFHWVASFATAYVSGFILLIPACGLLTLPWYPVSTIVNANGTQRVEYETLMRETPWYIVWIFLMAYLAALITQAYAVATLFSSNTKAVIVALLVYWLSFTPFVLVTLSRKPSINKQIISCLFVNSAMGVGWSTMLGLEYNGEGATFDNMWDFGPRLIFPLGFVIMMLCFDAVMHMLFCMYVLAVFPEDESTPKPWYFLTTKTYWCPKRYPSDIPSLVMQRRTSDVKAFTEATPAHTPVSVNIMHLQKIIRGNIAAIKDLSMKLFEGQVTVFIGQEGAGKKTIMRLLGGVTLPTSGTATIYGHDLNEDMWKVRHRLGFCSRNNVMYENLTVEDNFKFFSMIRGVTKADVEREVNYYIDLLDLQRVRKKSPRGMTTEVKRKLSIALAFCGHTKLVLLDEPSHGLDLAGKRELWHLIRGLKPDRTVIVNTNFIDEAEALGDRIAIMAQGELQCYGSLTYLKSKYGVGYYLHVQVRPELNVSVLSRMLGFYVPNLAEPEVLYDDDHKMYELHYTLPKSQSAVFGDMLADLEGRNGIGLGVLGYNVNMISFGEVFLKIITRQHHKSRNSQDISSFHSRPDRSDGLPRKPLRIISGPHLIVNHILAMFMKRILIFTRNLLHLAFMLIAIILILWFAMSEVSESALDIIMPTLKLSTESSVTLLGDIEGTALENNNDANRITDAAKGLNVQLVDEVLEDILKKRTESNLKFRRSGIDTAITLEASQGNNKVRMINWYSEVYYHAEGRAAAQGFSLIYHLATDGRTMYFHNHPIFFEFNAETNEIHSFARYLQVTVLFLLIMSLIAASFSVFYVTERVSQSKYYQFISGVTVWVFLLIRFICDYAIYLILTLIVLLLLALFQRPGFNTVEDLYEIFILLVSFGFVAIPLTHLISKAYTQPKSAILKMTTMNFMIGMLLLMIVWAFDQMKLETLERTKSLFMLCPFYAIADAFLLYQKLVTIKQLCNTAIDHCQRQDKYMDDCIAKYCKKSHFRGFTCCASDGTLGTGNFFAMEKLGQHLMYFYGTGAFLIAIVVVWEYGGWRQLGWILAKMCTNTKPTPEHDEDEDVLTERIKISKYPKKGRDYSLVLKDVTKKYRSNVVLNGLCAAVKKGECFGLLGPTGSGKSTTIQLVTGEERIGFGTIYVFGRVLSRRHLSLIRKQTSYCPQLDPLFDDMTVRETLVMYSLIKGIHLRDTLRLAETLAVDLEFTEFLNQRTKHLSRGNKRKVSVALSLIGKPKMIFMDEPTMGMDPRSKKLVWRILASMRDKGTSILLTTHSMAEGQALCDRLAIMIQGTFNAMGTMELLKKKFSKGYTVDVKLESFDDLETESATMDEIEEFFESTFKNVILIERHLKRLTFFTEDEEMSCSDMFKEMEKAKADYPIKEYTIGQSKLEQVFLYFTRRQGA